MDAAPVLIGVHPPPMAVVVRGWLDSAIDSPNTKRCYQRHVRDALAFLGCESLTALRGADLAAWRAEVMARSWGPASQAQCLAALRSFLTWARSMEAHRLPKEVIDVALKIPRSDVRRPYGVLSDAEGAAMIRHAGSVRNAALIGVMLGGGLRASETVGLGVEDLIEDSDGEYLLHVLGKGRRSRDVPIQRDLAGLLRRYLARTGRQLGETGPFFRPHDTGAATRGGTESALGLRSIGYVVEGAANRAGITAKIVSPHTLRHSFAVRCLRAGHDAEAVRRLLGHASIATTQRYLDHLQLGELRAAVPELPKAMTQSPDRMATLAERAFHVREARPS